MELEGSQHKYMSHLSLGASQWKKPMTKDVRRSDRIFFIFHDHQIDLLLVSVLYQEDSKASHYLR